MMNVLIVEDNPISSKVLEHTLDKYGYGTYSAKDGDQALEYLDTHPEIQLVITDIVMPKTDGVELVRRIKDRPEFSDIPILVCTSQTPASVNSRLPMDGWKYMFKPIRADSLMQKVTEMVSQQRPVMQKPDQTMAQVGMDSQAFLDLLDEFLKVVKDKITLLEENIKQHSDEPVDLQDLMESAKLLRADRVTEILERLNRFGVGKPREMIQPIYAMLLRELKSMQHYLAIYSYERGLKSLQHSRMIYSYARAAELEK
jgi:CheY-like chemotaxis protein